MCLNNGNVVGDGCWWDEEVTRTIFGLGKGEDEYMNAENKGSDFLIERKVYFLELFKYRNCSNRTNKNKIPVSKFH